jgi:antitoxin VapB
MPNRQSRIVERQEAARARVAKLRAANENRPLLVTTPGAVNWITGGLSDPIDIASSSDPVWALDSAAGRVLITSEIEAPRIAGDFEIASAGWDVAAVPWFEADAPLNVATDYCETPIADFMSDRDTIGRNITNKLIRTRMALSTPEQDDLRELGSLVGLALATGIDTWSPGSSTDYDIAAVIGAELERHGAKAVCLIVGGDDRVRTLRHPLAIGEVVNDALMAVVVARRGGLHVAATRIAVRLPDDPIIAAVEDLGNVHRAVVESSARHETWGESIAALAAGYEAIGHAGSWREHFQGGPIAFEQREFELAPGQTTSPFWFAQCEPGTAVAWNPSATGGAKIEETYLVGDDGVELITASPSWPMSASSDGPVRGRVKVVQ